jgi:hypothetical protein
LSPDAGSLAAAPLIDSDHTAVRALALAHAQGGDDRQRAVALCLAARDGFRCDP